MGTTLGPKYILYSYMEPLGHGFVVEQVKVWSLGTPRGMGSGFKEVLA